MTSHETINESDGDCQREIERIIYVYVLLQFQIVT